MLEGEQRQELLGNLHQGLLKVSAEVGEREARIVHGPEIILSVGELSEMRIDPTWAALQRNVTYFYYNFRASFVPEQKVVEHEIATSIARRRTERVNKSLVPEVTILEDKTPLPY